MRKLVIDYISDLHLGFYLPYNQNTKFNKNDIKYFVNTVIKPKIKGEVLVIAGDICEDIDVLIEFLNKCSNYYERIFFVAGNHEYYLTTQEMLDDFDGLSENKIRKINKTFNNNEKIIFLDRFNGGLYDYKGFTIAGDTLWYLPIGLEGWFFYMTMSNDSRLITDLFPSKERIMNYHLESVEWYDSIPKVDLLITHVPPIHNPHSLYDVNSCYLCSLQELKTKTWIYGHDHVEADFKKCGTRFLSNPWGYKSTDFKIKTIEIIKED